MQTIAVTGKIYGLKPGQTSNGKDKVSFRVGVRKQFVTDQDKQNNNTNVFLPMVAMGPTAKFIVDYFKDGDFISVGNAEYRTYRSQNADPNNNFDDAHFFAVNSVGFAGDSNGGGGNNSGQRSNGGNNNAQRNQRPANNNNQRNQRPDNNAPVDDSYAQQDDLPF